VFIELIPENPKYGLSPLKGSNWPRSRGGVVSIGVWYAHGPHVYTLLLCCPVRGAYIKGTYIPIDNKKPSQGNCEGRL